MMSVKNAKFDLTTFYIQIFSLFYTVQQIDGTKICQKMSQKQGKMIQKWCHLFVIQYNFVGKCRNNWQDNGPSCHKEISKEVCPLRVVLKYGPKKGHQT